ncbi:MAG: mechanosensitive ion channel domain-containing protein [Chitinophagales bacterium]
MKNIFLFTYCLVNSLLILAQDSTKKGQPKSGLTDSAHLNQMVSHGSDTLIRKGRKKLDYFKVAIKHEHRKFDSSLFTDTNIPSTSDYAMHLGKMYQTLDDVQGTTETFAGLQSIHRNLDNEDLVLEVVKERISRGERTFNVHNLQMFNTLLDALDRNTDKYSGYLDEYDSTLGAIRGQIADLRKDTLMKHIFGDTALTNIFQLQLQLLRSKWREVDSLITEDGLEINTLTSYTAAHSISIGELLDQVDMEFKIMGSRAFKKEYPYLWQPAASPANNPVDNFKESFESEQQLARFYFANTNNSRFVLLLMGILFFFWINYNFRRLRRLKKMEAIKDLDIIYVNPIPLVASLIFMLSLAPLFDTHGPAIYIELIQFLIMALLTFVIRKHISPKLLYGWYIFIFLFLILSVSRIFGLPLVVYRWVTLVSGISSVMLGIYFLIHLEVRANKWIVFAVSFYIFFNLLAIACNLLSRVTLSQIFTFTGFYSLAQTVSLAIFVRLVTESFLLQVQTSRISKNYPQAFDSGIIARSIRKFAIIIAVILWLIVFTINLNLFDTLYDRLTELVTRARTIGSFSFTIGGVLLFLGIIWLANFLQKYIAYFFGDTGDDAGIDDRGQKSRLMITRLILLTAGFLLAVAASGLSVDRITVIIGALGIGVGLGLQNIVNNFVSGIILIFDRPLRIGDIVDVGDKRGRVKGIGIRASTLLTEEGAEVIIPNGELLSNKIVNWTLSNSHARATLSFVIKRPENPENIDLAEIKKIISENHNAFQQREPEIVINPVNSKTVELKVSFWVNDFNKETVTAGELKTAIYKHLESKGLVAE